MRKVHLSSHIYTRHQKTTENQPSKGNLYLGAVAVLGNQEQMKEKQIGCVLSVIDKSAFNKFEVQQKIKNLNIKNHKWIDILDTEYGCVQFIGHHLETTNVFVHCHMGVSRSASIMIAFIMKEMKLNYENARFHVKFRRKNIFPNDSFVKSLKDYDIYLKQNEGK